MANAQFRIILTDLKILDINGKPEVKYIEYELDPRIQKEKPVDLGLTLRKIISEQSQFNKDDILVLEDAGDKYNIVLNNKTLETVNKKKIELGSEI